MDQFNKCCAKYIRVFYLEHGITLYGHTSCPKCGHFIGFSPSTKDYVDNFLIGFGLQPLPKTKGSTN